MKRHEELDLVSLAGRKRKNTHMFYQDVIQPNRKEALLPGVSKRLPP
jgi:hypothetical protein